MAQTLIQQYKMPVTYFGVAYELTLSDQQKFEAMRNELSNQLGDSIYLSPSSTLHVSITHITAAKDGDKHHKEYTAFFEKHKHTYIAALEKCTKEITPFPLTFYTLQASEAAFIAQAQPSSEIDSIRKALAPLPKCDGRNVQLGFVHSTQARYSKETSLEAVQQKIKQIDFSATFQVNTVQLVQSAKESMASHTILRSFSL